jgi:CDGSH-type Zn-finger protein
MSELKIKARKNGPYMVPGSAVYTDADGEEQKTKGEVVALCRCGGSKNKPFCDGTHRKNGFEAPEVILTLE